MGLDEDDGWNIVDVPSTHARLRAYKNKVFGVYWEVLRCLLDEGGRGHDPSAPPPGIDGANSEGNGFYRLGDNISACREKCAQNLCCQRKPSDGSSVERSNIDVEGMQLDSPHSSHSPTSGEGLGGQRRSTTKYGNNPLVGDVGNMGNLTAKAKSDGRELYALLTSLLDELSALESASSDVLRVAEDREQLKKARVSEEALDLATGLLKRAAELRELSSRIKAPSSPDGNGENDNNNGDEDENQQRQRQNEEEAEDVGAEAVRRRLEEQGGTASSSSSAMGMAWSAARAFGAMIDPPPHDSIFGLDVIRGTFLARYAGARQFWVERNGGGAEAGAAAMAGWTSSRSPPRPRRTATMR